MSLGTLRGHRKVIFDCIHKGYIYNCITYNTYSSLPAQAPALLSVSSAVWISLLFFFFFPVPVRILPIRIISNSLSFRKRALGIHRILLALKYLWVVKGIVGPLLCDLMMLNVCPWAHWFLEPGGHWTHPLCLPQRGVCNGVSDWALASVWQKIWLQLWGPLEGLKQPWCIWCISALVKVVTAPVTQGNDRV